MVIVEEEEYSLLGDLYELKGSEIKEVLSDECDKENSV
jgi:hypothetical protein